MPYDKLFKRAGEEIKLLTTVEEIRAFLEIDDAVTGITATMISNWNTAYGWGNHASAGYLTAETDPTVGAHIKAITNTQITNWDAAFGWGNHASAGYLTALPSHTHPLSALTQSGASPNQVPQWNGSAWVPVTLSLSDTHIGNTNLTLTGNRTLELDTFTFGIKKGANTNFHVFNNGRVWIGNGTPSDGGFQLDVNGSLRVGTIDINSIGSFAAGRIYRDSAYGLVVSGVAGSNSDLTFVNRSGSLLLRLNNSGDITYGGIVFYGSSIRIGGSYANNINNITSNITYGFLIGGGNNGSRYDVCLTDRNGAFAAGFTQNGTFHLIGILETPNSSSAFQINSTTRGLLPPRMTTTQKNAISSPATGLQIYDSTLNSPDVYNGTAWHHQVIAPNSTKVTAGAPYTNDGYVEVVIGGTTFKLMTTA